jgi:hypothetical protein
MDFANRGNRPGLTPQQPIGSQQEKSSPSFQPGNNNEKKSKTKPDFGKLTTGILLIGTTVLMLALILGLVFGAGSDNKETVNEASLIDTSKYQAVFLDSQDGQVYFGKLEVHNSDFYVLTDIYYVRVENPIQPEGANQQQQPNISLAKLGNELHGPEDFMFIRRDKVLYWENLKDDGQVVTAITEFKANGGENANQSQQSNQPAANQQNSGAPQQAVPATEDPSAQ